MVRISPLVLGASLIAEAQGAITWGVAGEKESCTAYCNKRNEVCTPGSWPADAYQMLRIAVASDHTKCTNVKLSQDKHAPSVTTRGADTDCEYNLEVGPNAPTCAVRPPTAAVRRFCACSPSGLRWYPGLEGQSCTDTCRVQGGICGDEVDVWPTSQDALKAVVSYIPGLNCKKHQVGSASFNPSFGEDGTCYWNSNTAGETAFCEAADWTNSNQKRICPCWNVE